MSNDREAKSAVSTKTADAKKTTPKTTKKKVVRKKKATAKKTSAKKVTAKPKAKTATVKKTTAKPVRKTAVKKASRQTDAAELTAETIRETLRQPTVAKPESSVRSTVTPDAGARHRMIAERAYRIAVGRSFRDGSPFEDWLRAETEIDNELSGQATH